MKQAEAAVELTLRLLHRPVREGAPIRSPLPYYPGCRLPSTLPPLPFPPRHQYLSAYFSHLIRTRVAHQ